MIENTGDPVADTIRFFQRLAAQARKNKLTGLEPRSGPGIDFNAYARQHYSAVNQFVQAAARTPSKITTDRMAKHLKAFGVASLEVQCLPPEGVGLPPDRLRTLSPKEVMQHAAYFAKMNSSGYDVYVRPAPKLAEDGKTVVAVAPYIFVDDVNKDKLARLKSLGLDLAIKIESSPGNFHGWVRISDTWLEPDVATQCAKMLAQEFGGDPRAADYRHFGRMAGFTNRKPSRRDASGKSPFVLLSAKEGYDVARSGPELIQAARQLVEARKQKDAERSAKVTEALRNQPRSLGQIGISHAAADAFAKFADKKDLSSLDFSVAMSLLARGFDPIDVQDEIRARSPDLAKRKGRDMDDYVARTVERAQSKIEQSAGAGPRMR